MGFPEVITEFPTVLDITVSDAPYVKTYQEAMEAGDIESANAALTNIPNYSLKIFNSTYFNSIAKTLYEVERFYATRYSSAYIVSTTQPPIQEPTDFWFQVTSTS